MFDYEETDDKSKPEPKAVTSDKLFDENEDILYKCDVTIEKGGYFGNIYVAGSAIKSLIPGRKERLLKVTNTALFCTKRESKDDEKEQRKDEEGKLIKPHDIKDVIIIDGNFNFEQHHLNKNHITVSNLDRKVEIRLETDNLMNHDKADELVKILEQLVENKPKTPAVKLPKNEIMQSIETFAEPEPDSRCRWFVQGRDYMWYLSHILDQAEHEIFITDWWFSPEIVLRRPKSKFTDKDWTLEEVLKERAKAGVQIYIMIFGSVGANMLNLGADRVRDMFNKVPNFQVIVHGAGIGDLFLWSHHEKLCIVDQSIAFVGGADLCAGRWDDDLYSAK